MDKDKKATPGDIVTIFKEVLTKADEENKSIFARLANADEARARKEYISSLNQMREALDTVRRFRREERIMPKWDDLPNAVGTIASGVFGDEADRRKLMAQEIAKAIQATQSGDGKTPDTVSLSTIDKKLNYLVNKGKATTKKQSAGGRKGAKAAKEQRSIDSQRDEIYQFVKRKIESGMKTDAAFAEAAQTYRKTASAIKSNYYREKNARKEEIRGKYDRKGKKRGSYKTISHVKN